MRYKALPLSICGVPVPPRTQPPARRPRPSGPWLVALLLPVLLVPQLSANAQETISLSPSQAKNGATIVVSGAGFAANTRGQILFDGQPTSMPTYRVDRSGSLTATFKVPMTAPIGSHTITAMIQAKKARAAAAAAVLATANLLVVSGSATPTPTPTPDADPDADPDAEADRRLRPRLRPRHRPRRRSRPVATSSRPSRSEPRSTTPGSRSHGTSKA